MAKPSRYKSDKVSSSSVSKKITTSSSAIQSVFGVDANQQIEDINVYNILKANGIYDRDLDFSIHIIKLRRQKNIYFLQNQIAIYLIQEQCNYKII